MPTIGQSGEPEDAGLDYRGGAGVSDGGVDEDFFMFGGGAKRAVIALERRL
jgi:hypothetical protein